MCDPLTKLGLRRQLPGAFTFDRTTEAFSRARAKGTAASDLLAPAMGASWFVNSAIPSTTFFNWLRPPLLGSFHVAIAQLVRDPAETAAWTDRERERLDAAIAPIGADGQGAGALSKVLAPLFPEVVPLMPDAMIAFTRGGLEMPEKLDAQTASIKEFTPTLLWFARIVTESKSTLDEIAEAHEKPSRERLTAAQVLDRLLWFESAGYRHFRDPTPNGRGSFVWVRSSSIGHEGIVHVRADRGEPIALASPVDLDAEPEGAFRTEATKALEDAARVAS